MKSYISAQIAEAKRVMSAMLADEALLPTLGVAAVACIECLQRGGPMRELCDHLPEVPSGDTPKIQEGHLVLGHILCGLVVNAIFKAPN
jgi:hypothetical protein